MVESSVYLDTSSIVKRYIGERGSLAADHIYAKAEAREHPIVMSLWNIGEVLGVFDRYFSRELITEDALRQSIQHFLAESQKMIRLGSMQILPLSAKILVEAYVHVLKHHIYQADALQIVTAKAAGCELFISADSHLLKIVRDEGLAALNIERQEDDVRRHL